MNRVLLIEDSPFFGSVVRNALCTRLQFEVDWAKTLAESQTCINAGNQYVVALVDLNLPDAEIGEAVDLTIKAGIPTVVFTGNLNDDVREHIWAKNVVDYVFKEGAHNIDYIVRLLRRIARNRNIKTLVVDDSSVSRRVLTELLHRYLFQTLEAENGEEAMTIIESHPDIKLVLTDYHMPIMDGFELTRRIRKHYGKDEMALIGISAVGNPLLSARFIKFGANDFIHKPFLSEEFFCRVSQNIDIIEQIEQIRNLSNRDYLSDLYNRRHFFELGNKLLATSHRTGIPVAVAMIDIDDFKQVNDGFGHEAGDSAIRQISQVLRERFRKTDVVARFGGEEFCILTAGSDPKMLFGLYNGLRKNIEQTSIFVGCEIIHVTVSIGVCSVVGETLTDMINTADAMLYRAKAAGKNRVVMDV